ncbi:MAG: Catabolite control protein A [Opitutia bacterium UBA7350]|nr:MAG: Catabolite control protein A [Opitutae bacterium UBA7350]
MRVNQQKIANALEISRTTVSRCFTNHPGINPDTRAAVFAMATKLGYTYLEPRGTNKSKSSSFRTMAVLICSDLDQDITKDNQSPGMQLLPGISEYALLNHIKLDIKIVNPRETNFKASHYEQLLKERKTQWDGVLLIYPFPSTIIGGLMRKFPCVSLVEQYGASDLDCIDVDHHRGVSHLMQKLIDQGHRRIGFFSWRYSVEALWVYRRYSAYIEKLARADLPYRQEDILNVYATDTYGLEEGYQKALQQTRDGVTAWICPADHIAYDFIEVFQKHGLESGKDYAITGFDGIPQMGTSQKLTTVQIPYRQIGYQAARRLDDLLSNRYSTTQHVYLNGTVIAGETDTKL